MANGTYSVEDHLLGPTFRRQAGSIFAPEYGDEGGGLYNVERENFGFSDDAYENLINLIEAGYLAGEPLEQAYETAQPGYRYRYRNPKAVRGDAGWDTLPTFKDVDPEDYSSAEKFYQALAGAGMGMTPPDIEVGKQAGDRANVFSTNPGLSTWGPPSYPSGGSDTDLGRYYVDKVLWDEAQKVRTSDDLRYVQGGEDLLPGIDWLGTTGQFAPTGAFEELFEVADGAPSLSHLYTYNPQIAMEDGILINPPSIFDEQSILGGLERLGMEDATPGMVRATPLSNLRALDPSAYTQFLQGRRRPLIEQLIGSIGAARGMGSGFAGYGKRGQAEETLKRKFGQNVGSIYSDIDSRRASAMNKLFSDLGELENLIANYRNEAV